MDRMIHQEWQKSERSILRTDYLCCKPHACPVRQPLADKLIASYILSGMGVKSNSRQYSTTGCCMTGALDYARRLALGCRTGMYI